MKAIVKNIALETRVKTPSHSDEFVGNMYHDGRVEEFFQIYHEWYQTEDNENQYNYHISWLEVVEP